MTFIKRALTTIIGLPAVAFVIILGGWPLYVVVCLAAMLGLFELNKAFAIPLALQVVGFAFTIINFAAVYFLGGVFWEGLLLYIIALATLTVVHYGKFSLDAVIKAAFGFLYVPFMLTFVLLVRDTTNYGHINVWIIFIACFGCDTFAYLVGSAFGKRKLVNSPSPSKTVAGIVGGVAGAGILGFLIFFFISRIDFFFVSDTIPFLTDVEALIFAVFVMIGAMFSIIGDMFGSALKRHTGIKDFGSLFPGHGGMMDRLDSIVIVAPFVFVVLHSLERMFG